MQNVPLEECLCEIPRSEFLINLCQRFDIFVALSDTSSPKGEHQQ